MTEAPQPTVAVVGASENRAKYGNKSVRAHLRQGYRVFPVNPHATEIEELPVWPSVADIPLERLDRITVYVPPEIGITLLEQFAAKHPREVWFNPGSENEALLRRAEQLGLPAITACSIVDLGTSPSEYSND